MVEQVPFTTAWVHGETITHGIHFQYAVALSIDGIRVYRFTGCFLDTCLNNLLFWSQCVAVNCRSNFPCLPTRKSGGVALTSIGVQVLLSMWEGRIEDSKGIKWVKLFIKATLCPQFSIIIKSENKHTNKNTLPLYHYLHFKHILL